MQNILNNLIILIVCSLFIACNNIEEFYIAVEQAAGSAKSVCDGKYKDDIRLLKSCKNGVEHLKYSAFNSERSLGEVKVLEDAKTLCQINYPSDKDRFNACLKGIHFLFIERDMYVADSKIGEQNNISELAISELSILEYGKTLSSEIIYNKTSHSIPQ